MVRTYFYFDIVARYALVLWAGATWSAGYIFVPIFFAHFAQDQAGTMAGEVFHAVNIMGLVCITLMLLDYRVRFVKRLSKQGGFWLLLCLLFAVLVQYLGLMPLMEKAKLLGDIRLFMRLHGVSQVIYLIQSIGLLWLVWLKFRLGQAVENES